MQDDIIKNDENENENENEENNSDKKNKKKQTNKERQSDFLLKMLSVFTALIIWFFVMWVDSPVSEKKFTSVPVQLENLDVMEKNGLSIIVERETSINVTVSGRKSAVNKLKLSDIQAYIDFKNVTSPGEHLLPIEIKEIDNITIVEQSETHTKRYIDTRMVGYLPVTAEIGQYMAEQGVTLTPINIKPNSIEISGPKGVIETLSHAQVNLNLSSYGKIERSLNVTEKIVLINENGDEVNNPYIKADQSIVEVSISVEMEKEVPLEVNFRYGYYTEKNTIITVTPSTLRVRGSPDFLSTYEKILLAPINEKSIVNPENTSLNIDIPLPELKNVNNITTATVEIEFVNTESREISFDVSNLKVTPPSGREYNIRDEKLRFKFLGPASSLNSIRQSNITATVDLSKVTEKGTQTVPVDVTITSYNSVFCVGEYTVNVEIY